MGKATSAITAKIIFLGVVFAVVFGAGAHAPAETTITAKVAGVLLDQSAANHVPLPATIVFSADQPVTIYYTTNGSLPTFSSPSAKISAVNGTVTGPTIDTADYMMLLQGVDVEGSLTPLLLYTFVSP